MMNLQKMHKQAKVVRRTRTCHGSINLDMQCCIDDRTGMTSWEGGAGVDAGRGLEAADNFDSLNMFAPSITADLLYDKPPTPAF